MEIQTTNTYEDYVTTLTTDAIDVDKLEASCLRLYRYIVDEFTGTPGRDYDGESTLTTALYTRYNLLMYPDEEIHNLYTFICKAFRQASGLTEPHWIQCWLNVYKRGNFIDWHTHWPAEVKSWHGYYGVYVDDSVTTYRVPKQDVDYKQIDVENINGQVIMSPSNDDEHRTWPWLKHRPRITVAFDIVPEEKLLQQAPWHNNETPGGDAAWNNHWLPVR